MGTRYKELQQKVNENKISKDEIKKTNVYKYLLSLNNLEKDQIFFANITSMNMEIQPDMLRIRNDKFLRNVQLKKKSVLISGINWNNKKIILVFLSESFLGYKHSTNSSNSFITFSESDLNNFLFNDRDTINFKNIYKNTNHEKSKYIFYTTKDINFNPEEFDNFYNVLVNDLKFQPYSSVTQNKYLKLLIPKIPEENKNIIRNIYGKKCALCCIDKNDPAFCPCGININIDYLENNNLNYTDIHHFIPKEYFLNCFDNDYINWEIVHSDKNLIPLCSACHQAIHKGNKYSNLVKNTFFAIKNAFDMKKRLDDFKKFLQDNTELKNLNNLLNFYIN